MKLHHLLTLVGFGVLFWWVVNSIPKQNLIAVAAVIVVAALIAASVTLVRSRWSRRLSPICFCTDRRQSQGVASPREGETG
jgi:hypothetical protein